MAHAGKSRLPLEPSLPTLFAMSKILSLIRTAIPEQRPGFADRRPERSGERWAIR